MNDLNGLHIAVLIISGLVIFLLLLYLLRSRPSEGSPKRKKTGEITSGPPTQPCPLCKEPLRRGETVHSVLYPGKPDSLMEIYGCKYCEKPGSKNERICPVCKNVMADESILIARVFEKPGKKHVHVLGCSSCYSGKTKLNKKKE